MENNEDKEAFLNQLEEASNPSRRFSVTRMKKRKSEEDDESPLTSLIDKLIPDRLTSKDLPEDSVTLSDGQWKSLLEDFDEISPIDDITYDDRLAYRRRKKNSDKFDDMFSKEQSMLNDLLMNLQKRSKVLDKKIDSLTSKGTYGIAKNFSDLVEASNTVEKTKLDVIKELVNIKKTSTDLRMKDQKNNPDTENLETKDTIADKFYKSIISGKSTDFIQSSMSSYGNTVLNNNNISQHMEFNVDEDYQPDNQISSYIQNENRNVQIYVCQHDDGTNEFIAIDDEGRIIENYDLPSTDLLSSLSIKPGSNFAYDIYSRKYPIISDEDISVTQDDYYDDYISEEYDEDDKYNYAMEAENDDVEEDE